MKYGRDTVEIPAAAGSLREIVWNTDLKLFHRADRLGLSLRYFHRIILIVISIESVISPSRQVRFISTVFPQYFFFQLM